MDYRRIAVALAAQLGVFVLGAALWLALAHGLYASALVCGIGAVVLASLGLTPTAFRIGRDLLRRNSGPGAIFTAELSRRRLQVLLDQTPSPLLLQPGNGQLIAVNRAARRLFDVSYALPTASRRVLLGDTEAPIMPGLQSLAGQIKWKGGTYAVHLAEMEEDEHVSHLAVLTDISGDVRAAEASALRDLLKVLNHELMNALTPVASMSRSALDILKEDGPDARLTAIKALERVVARTENLSGFINAYRALTRLPPPALRTVELDPWLEVLQESFAAQWGDRVTLTCDTDADLSAVMDEDQMWLCVGNLLNNGAQAALEKEGGEKAGGEKSDPQVRVAMHRVDDQVCFAISDSGKGIPADQADQVFLPFYTTKETGTGVGLSLARQIVQSHGSALSLLPRPGDADALSGARFGFQLRAAGA